jgi:hypothetical protein
MHRSIKRQIAILAGVLSLVGLQSATAASFNNSYLDGATWNSVYAQGFSPAALPNPDLSLSFTDNVSLERFQFFKSGTADSIGAVGGPPTVQLAILSNIYADLTNLSASSPLVVGLSTNAITSTSSLAVGAPISFNFNGLQLRYGGSYGAVVVTNNGGTLTPVLMSALTANYALQPDSSYHPATNYGGETDYNWSTSNFIQTNEFGSYFFGFSFGGDANFTATLNRVIHGDFNDDGLVDATDLSGMLVALTNLPSYQSSHGFSNNDLVLLGDFDGDQQFTNTDIQPYLDYLAAFGFGSGVAPVPEPPSIALLSCGSIFALCAASWWPRRARSAIAAR